MIYTRDTRQIECLGILIRQCRAVATQAIVARDLGHTLNDRQRKALESLAEAAEAVLAELEARG